MRRSLPLIIIAVVLVSAISTGFILFRSRQIGSSDSGDATPGSSAKSARINDVITLEEFGDYQCPPCGVLHQELKKIKQERGSQLVVVFRNLPLSQIHHNAMPAAQAAEAARLQNHFWEMHDLLYERQNDWKDQKDQRPTFLDYAHQIGLDLDRFARDMDGSEVQRQIERDKQAAASLRIEGTPTILIEGHQLRAEATTGQGIRRGIEAIIVRNRGQR
jgi:protein-disulfide isomerase